jgi:hypothetical protein
MLLEAKILVVMLGLQLIWVGFAACGLMYTRQRNIFVLYCSQLIMLAVSITCCTGMFVDVLNNK